MKGDLADQMAHLIMDENKAIEKEDGLQDFLMTTAKQRVLLRAIESLGGTVFLAHDMGVGRGMKEFSSSGEMNF